MNTDSTKDSLEEMRTKIVKSIKAHMFKNFITNRSVAKELGMTESYISTCLSDNSKVNISKLFKIAKAAGMEVGVRTFTLPEKPVDKE